MEKLPLEIRLMILKEARTTAFKEKIARFDIIHLDLLHRQWTDHRLWMYRQSHDTRSADDELEEMTFWGGFHHYWLNHNNGA